MKIICHSLFKKTIAVFAGGVLLLGVAGVAPEPAQAASWTDLGTTSGTLSANQLCKTDGSNIICDTTTPSIVSGAVGIGTASPNAAALLDLTSTTQGLLPPRMTNAQMTAIASPPAGLTIYNSTNSTLYVYNGSAWSIVGGAASGVAGAVQFSTGTALNSDATNFFWDNTNKRLGLGVSAPAYTLDMSQTNSSTASGINYVSQAVMGPAPATDSAASFRASYSAIWTSGVVNYTNSLISSVNATYFNAAAKTLAIGEGVYNLAQNNGTGTISTSYGAQNLSYNASTGTITTGYGAYDISQNSSTGTITNAYGSFGDAYNGAGGTMTNAYGSYGRVYHNATTTMASAAGVYGLVQNNTTGTITNAYSVTAALTNNGTVTNWYGLYVPALTGTAPATLRYPLYIADTGTAYIAGTVQTPTVHYNGVAGSAGSTSAAVAAGATGQLQFNDGSNNFAANSVLRWDNVNLRLGIGTASVANTLDVYGGAAIGTYAGSTGVANGLVVSGNVGIGTTSPAVALETRIASGSGGIRVTQPNAGLDGYFSLNPTSSGGHEWQIAAADPTRGTYGADFVIRDQTLSAGRFVIDTSGNVGIGTTSPSYKLDVWSSAAFPVQLGSNGLGSWQLGPYSANDYFYIIRTYDSVGVYLAYGGSSWAANSDARLKKNIEPLKSEDGLAAIMNLRPISYNWVDQRSVPDKQYGFIAQEVEKVMPQFVTTGKDVTIKKADGTSEDIKNVKGLTYSAFVVPLTKAVQELKSLFDALNVKVAALIAKVGGHDDALAKLKTANDNLAAAHAADAKAIDALRRETAAQIKALRDAFAAYKAGHP